jgi:hypothetical protein
MVCLTLCCGVVQLSGAVWSEKAGAPHWHGQMTASRRTRCGRHNMGNMGWADKSI